ncbi:MFS transporter [Roseiflexus sp. RS-1]|jgi:MFS family permease|uniref:MFS transporter n=1 Tax=Roseiflexus sp. (strain RS-1) TaxID=357808 RepID=UPI0000D810C2|nr:MFS transporter [Roseiflexus sp. RS-1]ABQ92151.1 major facilitator superfamily MFS_1 [Roseiflexus sp. RS-1]
MSMIEDAMTAQPAGIWVAGRRMLTVGLTLIIIATAFEMLAVAATMPATAQDLGGLAWYGWAFSAFMLANMVAATVAGPEADRRGIATPFIAGTCLFVGGLLIAGLAPTMPLLIVGRAVQGLGSGIIGAVVYIIVGRGYETDARPRMLAIISSAWVVPGMVSPGVAGIITETIGWRWVFLGLIPLPILAACMALPSLRRLAPAQHSTSGNHQRNREIRLALVLATGAGMVIGGLGWMSAAPPTGVALLSLGAVATIIALRQVLPAGTLRAAPGLPAAIAAMGLLNLAFFGVDAFVPLALTTVRGLSIVTAGLALTAATLTWTAGAWMQARLARRMPPGSIAVLGLLVMLIGISATTATVAPVMPALLSIGTWGIAGCGIGLAYSALSLAVLQNATQGHEGRASSALQIASQLGTALGAGIGGVIIGSGGSGITVAAERVMLHFVLMIVVTGIAVLTAWRVER